MLETVKRSLLLLSSILYLYFIVITLLLHNAIYNTIHARQHTHCYNALFLLLLYLFIIPYPLHYAPIYYYLYHIRYIQLYIKHPLTRPTALYSYQSLYICAVYNKNNLFIVCCILLNTIYSN